MNAVFLKNNLDLLARRDPGLAASLRRVEATEKYIAEPSRAGLATLSCVLPDGTRKTVHSAYDPVQEASRFVDACRLNESSNIIVTGMGLGYHVMEIIRRVPRQSRILIIEKDPELFLLALTCNDLTAVLNHPGISFHIGIDPRDLQGILSADRVAFALNATTISFKPLTDLEVAYYHAISKTLENLLQETRIDFKTQTAFSKSFYSNIMDNLPFILGSIGVNAVTNRLPDVPAVIVSAGPSLDKNIALLKNVQDNVVLIAVATALTPLLKNGIEPDFVVAIDPDETMLRAFDLENPPQKTWLLFDPGILPPIPECFKAHRLVFDSNIYLSQWIAKHNGEKGSLGKTQSVAHTALKFAQHLGCRPIILAGQDLAFNQHRLHCSGSFFYEQHQDGLARLTTMTQMDRQNYQIYGRALVTTPDIFGNPATTTLAMRSYNNLFANELDADRDILNATEGGIPIPRIQNLPLREALNTYCRETIQETKRSLARALKPASRIATLSEALKIQADKLRQLQTNLLDVKNRFSQNPGKTGQIQFIREMENVYRTLVDDFDTVQLLQGYAYSGFLQWNQMHHEIARKAHSRPEEEILQSTLERDRQFIDILSETADHLQEAFEKMAGQVTAMSSAQSRLFP